jgi:hypothetical protein
MKVYRELSIKGSWPELETFISRIAPRLGAEGWGAVEYVYQHDPSKPFCFTCPETAGRTESEIWMARRDPDKPYLGNGELYVSNIVPKDYRGQLSCPEYNAILTEFYERFVRPEKNDPGLTINLSDDDVGLEKWLTPTAAQALRLFSENANKSTGASHPMDRKRWYQFLILADKENARLDASTLARWLTEEAGWADTTASELADDYERARSLLAYEHAG